MAFSPKVAFGFAFNDTNVVFPAAHAVVKRELRKDWQAVNVSVTGAAHTNLHRRLITSFVSPCWAADASVRTSVEI
jgi:hypothetical protein